MSARQRGGAPGRQSGNPGRPPRAPDDDHSRSGASPQPFSRCRGSDSYTTYVDLGRDYVTMNVVATPELSAPTE